jgi:RIO-like serine/threonine protein kinase
MNNWQLTQAGQTLADSFGSLDAVFLLQGELVTADSLSEVIKFHHLGVNYYVKRYKSAGKGLRRIWGKPRVQGEWENLQQFATWRIPTATVIAFGIEKNLFGFVRGAIVTQEIPNTQDLAFIAAQQELYPAKIKQISEQLATITSTLHQQQFVHNDLKWRNVLVDNDWRVYLIDCPLGGFWRGSFLHYRIVKDLFNLNSDAKRHLSKTQRMCFFLRYCNTPRLTVEHKKLLQRVLRRKSRRHDKQSNLGLVFRGRY